MRRIDDLQLNGLKIIQETDHFCFGTDSVLLANFAVRNSLIKKETKIIDFGTGNGIIPLLLAGKTESEHIIGIEIQKEVASLAQENVDFNNLQNRIKIINGDIVGDAALGVPHIITCNPPYKPFNSGLLTNNQYQNIARNEIKIALEQILTKASELLQDKGKLFMVHKPERIAEIIKVSSQHKLEPKRIKMVHNDIKKPPCLVLIEFVKNGATNLIIEPPEIIDNA